MVVAAALQAAIFATCAAADEMIPSDHWAFDSFTESGQTYSTAAVMATSRDNVLEVVCDSGGVYISIAPRKPLTKAVADRGLTLAFDGGAPIAQHWKTGTLTGGGIGHQDYFEVADKDPQFQPVIDAFKQRREVDVSLTDSGKEVQHQTFTLNGAPRAIDKVLAACKK